MTPLVAKHLKNMSTLALLAIAGAAHAQIAITEVDPAGSGTGSSSYNQDWFELTNLGASAQSLVGWSMLDNNAASNPASPYSGTIAIANASAGAVALAGVTSLAAGQSVIFIENTGNNAAATATEIAKFESIWFGANVPANFLIGTYDSTGKTKVGLSQTADMVNIFSGTASGSALVASVAFGNDGTAVPLATWDNSAGLNNVTLTAKSVAGAHGAFVSPNGQEIGSPGVVSAVPEPEGLALSLAGFGALVLVRRKKSQAVA